MAAIGLDMRPHGCYAGIMSQHENQLLSAARAGDITTLECLLLDMDTTRTEITTAMRDAVARNAIEVIPLLMKADIGPHTADAMLHLAAVHGHDQAVRCIMMASPTGTDDVDTVLRWAIIEDDAAAVRTLIRAGANVRAKNNESLFLAAAYANADVVRAILAAGADVHADDDIALYTAVSSGRVDVIDLLLGAGATVETAGRSALWKAARFGHVAVVQRLWAAHHPTTASAAAALVHAAICGHTDVVRCLLAAGADPVVAWSESTNHDRRRMAATLDACVDAMQPEQRIALAAKSRMLSGLRAFVQGAHQQHRLQRR